METVRELIYTEPEEPVSLTDAQLDMVAGGLAAAQVMAVNVTANGTISLSSAPTFAGAEVLFSFDNVGTSTPQFLGVAASASTPQT